MSSAGRLRREDRSSAPECVCRWIRAEWAPTTFREGHRMAEVLLFHHALGLTPGVHAFADSLRQAGHTVHTPDLFDGRTFDDIKSGVGYAQEVGFEEVRARGDRAAADLPANRGVRRVLARRGAGPAARPDPGRRRGGGADGVLRPGHRVRRALARRSARADPRPGRRRVLRRRRRHRVRRGDRRGGRRGESCSSTPATATSSRTPRPRATTPRPRRCCSSGCWGSSTRSAELARNGFSRRCSRSSGPRRRRAGRR